MARDVRADDQFVNVLANAMAANAVSDLNGDAMQSSPLVTDDPLDLTSTSGIYSATTLATTSVTIPDIPYSIGPDPTCTDYSTAPATTTFSTSIPFWPLPTICLKSPALCGTGSSLWTVHLDKTESPRMNTPAPQTAHRERPQGWLVPPYAQVAASPSQTGYIEPTEANPDHPLPLSTGPVRVEQKVPTAELMNRPTQDPQAARLEVPALNLDIPGPGRVRRALPSQDLASETLPLELVARAKIPKPQPQTARSMATKGIDLGGPQLGGPDDGHPVGAGSSSAKLNNRDCRDEDSQASAEDEDDDTDPSTASIWDSHANPARDPSGSFTVALMAAILSALVLVMVL